MWSWLMEVVESDPLMKTAANLGMATAAGSRAREPRAHHVWAASVRHRRGPRVREAQPRAAMGAPWPTGVRVRDGGALPQR
jgi:hypothetical protein